MSATVFLTVRQDYRRPQGGSFTNERHLTLVWCTSPAPEDWGGPVDLGTEFNSVAATAAAKAAGVEVESPWAFLALNGIWRAQGHYVP